jgi:outer membrane cobalamin receptor
VEFNVPLAKDIPALQDVSLNLAGRRAKYSNFDAGDSWKIGLNWQIVDAVRFRGTLSSDFRAPNMNNPVRAARCDVDGLPGPAHGWQQSGSAARHGR